MASSIFTWTHPFSTPYAIYVCQSLKFSVASGHWTELLKITMFIYPLVN